MDPRQHRIEHVGHAGRERLPQLDDLRRILLKGVFDQEPEPRPEEELFDIQQLHGLLHLVEASGKRAWHRREGPDEANLVGRTEELQGKGLHRGLDDAMRVENEDARDQI